MLFVCLTIRAIHTELADCLGSNLAVIYVRNFVNLERGPPLKMVSDNGTNLRASEKELRKAEDEREPLGNP